MPNMERTPPPGVKPASRPVSGGLPTQNLDESLKRAESEGMGSHLQDEHQIQNTAGSEGILPKELSTATPSQDEMVKEEKDRKGSQVPVAVLEGNPNTDTGILSDGSSLPKAGESSATASQREISDLVIETEYVKDTLEKYTEKILTGMVLVSEEVKRSAEFLANPENDLSLWDQKIEEMEKQKIELQKQKEELRKKKKESRNVVAKSKKIVDSGVPEKMIDTVPEKEITEIARDDWLKITLKNETEDAQNDTQNVTPEDFVAAYLGENGDLEKSALKNFGKSGPTVITTLQIVIYALAGHMGDLNRMVAGLATKVNALATSHNESLKERALGMTKSTQSGDDINWPLPGKGSVQVTRKTLDKKIDQSCLRNLKKLQEEERLEEIARERCSRQLVVTRVPEIPEHERAGKSDKQVADMEAERVVEFIKTHAVPNTRPEQFPSQKEHITVEDISTIKRINWSAGSLGLRKGRSRKLHINIREDRKAIAPALIRMQNKVCAERNKEIAEGKVGEDQRIHRYVQVQHTDSQRALLKKTHEWCNRQNAYNREENPGCDIWVVHFRDNGDPYKRLEKDKHPTRTAELGQYWKEHLPNGKKHRERKKKGKRVAITKPEAGVMENAKLWDEQANGAVGVSPPPVPNKPDDKPEEEPKTLDGSVKSPESEENSAQDV